MQRAWSWLGTIVLWLSAQPSVPPSPRLSVQLMVRLAVRLSVQLLVRLSEWWVRLETGWSLRLEPAPHPPCYAVDPTVPRPELLPAPP